MIALCLTLPLCDRLYAITAVVPRLIGHLQALHCLSELHINGNHLGRTAIEAISAGLPRLRRYVTDLPYLDKGKAME